MGLTKRDMLLLRYEFPARPGLLPFGVVLYYQPARPQASLEEQLQDVLKGKFIVHNERVMDGDEAGRLAYDNGAYFEHPADAEAYQRAYAEFQKRVAGHLAVCARETRAGSNPIEEILRYRAETENRRSRELHGGQAPNVEAVRDRLLVRLVHCATKERNATAELGVPLSEQRYRVTVPTRYPAGTAGHVDPIARQGHYASASYPEEAARKVQRRLHDFEGGLRCTVFDVQVWDRSEFFNVTRVELES